nr:hypothetical protein [Pseudovibrio axinellae]
MTIWVNREIGKEWSAQRRTTRGGQRKYSDLAIERPLQQGHSRPMQQDPLNIQYNHFTNFCSVKMKEPISN